jgi:monofunctional chorismate mutase
MNTIEELRKEIDETDDEIIRLLDSRYDISVKIGALKKNRALTVYDKSREDEIYAKIARVAVHKEQIAAVYSEIMKQSREMQK